MSEVGSDSGTEFGFELQNVGAGNETVTAETLGTHGGSVLLVLLRSHYCPKSRELVRTLCDRHEAFRQRDTAVVSVLPDIRERGRLWDQQYDLPFALLVDPETEGLEEGDGFGTFETLRAEFDDLPAVALCACTGDGLSVVELLGNGKTVPSVDAILASLDERRGDDG